MAIGYKINILAALKDAGYNTGRIRRDRIMGEATLQKLRSGELVSWATLDKICRILDCQPGDLLVFVREESETVSEEK